MGLRLRRLDPAVLTNLSTLEHGLYQYAGDDDTEIDFEYSPTVSGTGTDVRKQIFRALGFIDRFPFLNRMLKDASLSDEVRSLLGDEPALLEEKMVFKGPGSTGVGGHQDYVWFGWQAFFTNVVVVAIPIVPTNRANGCLEFALERSYEPMGSILTKTACSELVYTQCPTGFGEVMIYDSLVPHRSGPNQTLSSRPILYLSYIRKAEHEAVGRYKEYFRGATSLMLMHRLRRSLQ